MVRLRSVSKSYPDAGKVLHGIELNLNRGSFLYLLGGSGAGKTTLLRMLATEEPASSGKIELFGYDLNRVSPSTLKAIRRSIGYIPQDVRLVGDMTVSENIALAVRLSGRSADSKGIGDLLERLDLAHRRDTMCSRLSGGEGQRVAVARALARKPELVLADEPTGAQDRSHSWNVMERIAAANSEGATVLLATHDSEITRRYRRPYALLSGGRVKKEDSRICT